MFKIRGEKLGAIFIGSSHIVTNPIPLVEIVEMIEEVTLHSSDGEQSVHVNHIMFSYTLKKFQGNICGFGPGVTLQDKNLKVGDPVFFDESEVYALSLK